MDPPSPCRVPDGANPKASGDFRVVVQLPLIQKPVKTKKTSQTRWISGSGDEEQRHGRFQTVVPGSHPSEHRARTRSAHPPQRDEPPKHPQGGSERETFPWTDVR